MIGRSQLPIAPAVNVCTYTGRLRKMASKRSGHELRPLKSKAIF
jgi:hypothetical protein